MPRAEQGAEGDIVRRECNGVEDFSKKNPKKSRKNSYQVRSTINSKNQSGLYHYEIVKFIKFGLNPNHMTVDKIVRRSATYGGMFVLGGIALVTGHNFYAHHNVSYEGEYGPVFLKADGIIAHTKLKIDKKSGAITVIRNHPLNWRWYEDNNKDEKVDTVEVNVGNILSRGYHSRNFHRDKHLEQYPVVFQEADRDFRQQMKRFKPYINR